MSEKMKCAHCGKRFKQTNKKQVLCADCLAKERLARKNAPALAQTGSGVAARTPAPTITIVQATPPPEEAIFGSQARNAERHSARGPQRSPHRYSFCRDPEEARDRAGAGHVERLWYLPSPDAALWAREGPPRRPKEVGR